MRDLKDILEDVYNAALFLKQENQIYYTVEIHSDKGYSQKVALRSDFIKEALKGQLADTTYKIDWEKEHNDNYQQA